ncbi:MAG: hypothetical protein QM582_14755 [Micropruina sp.]|uniref:hypothetical protein n=1 Tax=Micropruina sp. TaxID=2737536 RepID=UPI0039E68AE4
MLRVGARAVLATVAGIAVAVANSAPTVADPAISDDGDRIVGTIDLSKIAKSAGKKRVEFYYQGKWLTYSEYWAAIAKCQASGASGCDDGDVFRVREARENIAIRLVARLRLPDATPQFGPDPSVNEWKMLAVGFPIWLWTSGPAQLTTSVSEAGETFTLTARRSSVNFAMGDGRTVTCTSMASYNRAVEPGAPSLDCGHRYSRPSLPKGSYTVRTTVNWQVSWSVAGQSGVLPTTRSGSRALPIGELVALNR